MTMEASRDTAVQIVDGFGVPREASMGTIRRIVQEVTGLDITYQMLNGLKYEEVHGVTSGYDDGTATIAFPPVPSGTQVVIVNHEHGHLLIHAMSLAPAVPLKRRREEFMESQVGGFIPGTRLGEKGTSLQQELVPNLVFEHGRSDFTEEQERLAELVGVELSVRVMRHERARGCDVQFGRVFGG